MARRPEARSFLLPEKKCPTPWTFFQRWEEPPFAIACAQALGRHIPGGGSSVDLYADEVAHTVASRPVPEGETWARSALTQLAAVPGVHRAGLALVEGGGRRLLFAASDRDNVSSVQWCEVDAYEDVPLNHTVRTGEAVVGSLAELARSY